MPAGKSKTRAPSSGLDPALTAEHAPDPRSERSEGRYGGLLQMIGFSENATGSFVQVQLLLRSLARRCETAPGGSGGRFF